MNLTQLKFDKFINSSMLKENHYILSSDVDEVNLSIAHFEALYYDNKQMFDNILNENLILEGFFSELFGDLRDLGGDSSVIGTEIATELGAASGDSESLKGIMANLGAEFGVDLAISGTATAAAASKIPYVSQIAAVAGASYYITRAIQYHLKGEKLSMFFELLNAVFIVTAALPGGGTFVGTAGATLVAGLKGLKKVENLAKPVATAFTKLMLRISGKTPTSADIAKLDKLTEELIKRYNSNPLNDVTREFLQKHATDIKDTLQTIRSAGIPPEGQRAVDAAQEIIDATADYLDVLEQIEAARVAAKKGEEMIAAQEVIAQNSDKLATFSRALGSEDLAKAYEKLGSLRRLKGFEAGTEAVARVTGDIASELGDAQALFQKAFQDIDKAFLLDASGNFLRMSDEAKDALGKVERILTKMEDFEIPAGEGLNKINQFIQAPQAGPRFQEFLNKALNVPGMNRKMIDNMADTFNVKNVKIVNGKPKLKCAYRWTDSGPLTNATLDFNALVKFLGPDAANEIMIDILEHSIDNIPPKKFMEIMSEAAREFRLPLDIVKDDKVLRDILSKTKKEFFVKNFKEVEGFVGKITRKAFAQAFDGKSSFQIAFEVILGQIITTVAKYFGKLMSDDAFDRMDSRAGFIDDPMLSPEQRAELNRQQDDLQELASIKMLNDIIVESNIKRRKISKFKIINLIS